MRNLLRTGVNLFSMLTAAPSRTPSQPVTGSAYDFEFPGIDGKPLRLSDWKGKVLLIVNTASFCGFTKQYAGLQELWTRYGRDGLIVLGVPCNDFGGQEPKSEGEIGAFCDRTFGVTFPLTAKQTVVGAAAHPFYKWAASAMGAGGVPKWNFHKYLVGRDGKLAGSFATKLAPDAPELKAAIEKALAA